MSLVEYGSGSSEIGGGVGGRDPDDSDPGGDGKGDVLVLHHFEICDLFLALSHDQFPSVSSDCISFELVQKFS